MSSLKHDFRYGLRVLWRNRALTAIVLLSLALGIGANTAIFSVVNSVLFRPLPFKDPEKLVVVWEDASFVGFPENTPSPGNYADWKLQNHVFSKMAAMRTQDFNLTGGGEPLKLSAYQVTADFFPLLGVQPVHGRVFTQSEDSPEANKVAVLSYGFWQSRFAGQTNIVGQDIILNNAKYTVIGIMPSNFQFFDPEISLWAPMAFTSEQLQNRNAHYLEVVARIKNGVTFDQAQSQIKTIMARIRADHPEETGGKLDAYIVPLRQQFVGSVRRPLILLLIAVALVLLIACANIANLLLSAATSRRKEIALRAALGADKFRLLRQMLTESLLLSGVGGILGLILGVISFRFLQQLVPPAVALSARPTLDPYVLLYTFAISILTGLIFGLVPSIHASKTDLNDVLKSGGACVGAGSGAKKLRSILVISEMALALILLVGAGLLIQTIFQLQKLNLGFEPNNVVRLQTVLPKSKYDVHEKRVQFYDQVLERVKGISGVVSAGYSTSVPLDWKGGTNGYEWEGYPPEPGVILDANHRQVTSEYVQTMKIPLKEGRYFDGNETATSMPVAIINEAMAKTYPSKDSPIGKRFQVSGQDAKFTVIGIAKNVRNMGLETETKAEMYLPEKQSNFSFSFYEPQDLAIRTTSEPMNVVTSARQIIRSIDPDLPVSNVITMNDLVAKEFAQRRFTMILLAAFAGLALLLACLGIYGVLSYFVNQQIPEIGVRLALGARPQSILLLVLKRGMTMALLGIFFGTVGAIALARVMKGLLYGITATDPRTFMIVVATLVVTALAASVLPGLRAMKTDPITALRYE
jgi:putative ABC transport system permease protein